MNLDETFNKLELHYYLRENSHSMDALTLNKCEQELLAIVYEAASQFGINLKIESEAYAEGGVRKFWKFLGDNSAQLSLLVAITAIVMTRVPVGDPEYDNLKKQELRLSIQQMQLQIKKLKNELESNNLTPEVIEDAVEIISQDLKVTTRRSNFYKKLSSCHEVTDIGLGKLDNDYKLVGAEKKVTRNEFRRFIFHSNKIKPLTVDDALIEIVSPVLKEGRYHWKGIFIGEPITFQMIDKEFKNHVLSANVPFQNGSQILCVLKINQKVNEIGEVEITGYSVDTVIKKIDGLISEETPQGIKYKRRKKHLEDQGELFAE